MEKKKGEEGKEQKEGKGGRDEKWRKGGKEGGKKECLQVNRFVVNNFFVGKR